MRLMVIYFNKERSRRRGVMPANSNTTFLQFRAECISERALFQAFGDACLPPLRDTGTAADVFRRSHAVAFRLRGLSAVLNESLEKTFYQEVRPRYTRGADLGLTRLQFPDIEDLCCATLRAVGAWRNELFVEPTKDVVVNLLGDANLQVDFEEFGRRLRNEVFSDLQRKYGFGQDRASACGK